MNLISTLINIYMYILLIRALLSWFPVSTGNPVAQFIYKITEPVLAPVRRAIPPISGNIDISPMVVFFGVFLLKNLFRI